MSGLIVTNRSEKFQELTTLYGTKICSDKNNFKSLALGGAYIIFDFDTISLTEESLYRLIKELNTFSIHIIFIHPSFETEFENKLLTFNFSSLGHHKDNSLDLIDHLKEEIQAQISKKRITLVDDDEDRIKAFSKLFSNHLFDVVCYRNSDLLFTSLSDSPHLFIISHEEVLRSIKNETKYFMSKVIMIASKNSCLDADATFENHFDEEHFYQKSMALITESQFQENLSERLNISIKDIHDLEKQSYKEKKYDVLSPYVYIKLLDKEIYRTRHYGVYSSLLYLDFKSSNPIQRVSKMKIKSWINLLRKHLSPLDSIGLLSDHEFSVIFPETTSGELTENLRIILLEMSDEIEDRYQHFFKDLSLKHIIQHLGVIESTTPVEDILNRMKFKLSKMEYRSIH